MGAPRSWAWPLLLLAFLATATVLSSTAFFSLRGGTSFLSGLPVRDTSLLLFPLAGLLAFFLLWFQALMGMNFHWLRQRLPWVVNTHMAMGGIVLLFALLHPLLLLSGVGWGPYWQHQVVAPELTLFFWIGQLQLLILLLTAGTALLRKLPWLKEHWFIFHWFNYAVFPLVWLHSWYLGTDVQASWLRWLWILAALSVGASMLGRLWSTRRSA